MKNPNEIKQKLKQVQFRHAKKEIEQLLAIEPMNCAHNRKLDLSNLGQIGFCAADSCPLKGKPCDIRIGTPATGCGHYAPLHSAGDARDQAKQFFATARPGDIARLYPDVAALLWALDEDRVEGPDPYLVGVMAGHPIWTSSLVGAIDARAELDALAAAKSLEPSLEPSLDSYVEYDDSGVRSDIARLMSDFSILSKSVHASMTFSPPGNRLWALLRPITLAIGTFVGRLGRP